GTVLDSIGKPRINFFYTLMSLGLTIVFNLVFISWLGVYGAALGTLSAYAVTFTLMQFYLNKHLGVHPLRPFVYMVRFYKHFFSLGKKALHHRSLSAAMKEE
ncbi:MAG TPA: hypothetical protein ENJ20_04020, partial [Bacteroidetes bacterium]|nr:hypothetical protein [Bacteroidota bacterium]